MRYLPVIFGVVLFIYGLIDCIRSESAHVRSIPKTAWIVVIVLLNVIGVGLWFWLGRPRYASGAVQRAGGRSAGSRGPYSAGNTGRSTAPDDDPEFLRNLAVNRAQKLEAEKLRKLKAELDAREAKLREEHPNDETKK
ncbi:PLD nuclease N-terminal domain-containing protein [Arthrobacter sp. HLT1-20]